MDVESNTVKRFDESEVQEMALNDADYPQLLKAISNPPRVLRVRGTLPLHTKISAISGSRKTTQQALMTAQKIGKMLAEHGYTVVTGLAYGCDAAAVEGALSVGGNRTIIESSELGNQDEHAILPILLTVSFCYQKG